MCSASDAIARKAANILASISNKIHPRVYNIHSLTKNIQVGFPHTVKNRSRPDIMAIRLESAHGGITKTRLLTKANVTTGQLRQYLAVLLDKKLVSEFADKERKHVSYRTTEKGIAYLAIYQSLRSVAVFPSEH